MHTTKLRLIAVAIAAMLISGLAQAQDKGFVNVMDYITDLTKDAAPAIQKAIDENPNRVIYFPDGKYILSAPIMTPADPSKSVCLELSNYAIIRPAKGWNHDEAMIRLGGKDPFNTILVPGSNYYLQGGVIDCDGVAKGISIDSGRETVIRDTSIKNALIGIHIKKGANNNSSDADVHDVNITGNMSKDCIGVLVEGYDNTFTNMRIYRCQIGVMLCSDGNMLRNIHPLYGSSDDEIYDDGCGFVDKCGNNWFDYCYSDQCATAFVIEDGGGTYHNCFAYWYSNRGKKHAAFRSKGPFNAVVTNFTMGVDKNNATTENVILDENPDTAKGTGCFQNIRLRQPQHLTSDAHKKYVR